MVRKVIETFKKDKWVLYLCADLTMLLQQTIKKVLEQVIQDSLGIAVAEEELIIQRTKTEFEGDYTLVLFGLVKKYKLNPEQIGSSIGEAACQKEPQLFKSYNLLKGFLNFSIQDQCLVDFLGTTYSNPQFGKAPVHAKRVMVEYSSPNTNKPLHLGHLRNIFLGWSIAELLKERGYVVTKSCVVNDRGIHICKSMIAWELFAQGATPTTTGQKGDHFVGDYYVKFNEAHKVQIEEGIAAGLTKEQAEKEAPIMKATQQLLQDWEAGKPEVLALWNRMNQWVYEGFEETYNKIGADFDKTYYESKTYLLGKKFVEQGLTDGVFYKKEDGSIWIDLTPAGLDEKLVLRKDGTSVYITQDLGLAEQKFQEYQYEQSIYVIADEQNYHMKVLQLILQKLNKPYANGIYHLSYGMVELPSGKMKSREGTVVDADDLIAEMIEVARTKTEELGKVKDFDAEELQKLYHTLALGALKFYLLRVDPKKKMIFNPQESIDFQGFTGPFIQYTYARIQSILRKESPTASLSMENKLEKEEKELLITVEQFPAILEQAVAEHNPSVVALYVFTVAKLFNSFYTQHSIISAPTDATRQLRLRLAALTATVIKRSMTLLGIEVPSRM
ncbi:arginine--tRNA ligase [Bacteroidota bacterium]|nr:arginine--tRNA ligase [Bacteroidota bacterium]